MSDAVAAIIADTTDEVFELAGGFAFVDEVAVGLNARWRSTQHGSVVVSALDLAWLLDGYARLRLGAGEVPNGD